MADMNSDAEYVEELVSDAKLVASYGRRAGLFTDARLYAAIAAVERLQAKDSFAQEVVDLQLAVNEASKAVPFTTLVALKEGWVPGSSGRAKKRLTVLLLSSVLLMIIAGQLFQVYSQGVAILKEINTLSLSDPDRRFGQLTRQLVGARQEISSSPPLDQEKDTLKRQAYFQIYDDLRNLDQRLFSVVSKVRKYEGTAAYPFTGSYLLMDVYYRLQRFLGYESPAARIHFTPQNPALPYSDGSGKEPSESGSYACQQASPFSAMIENQVKYIGEKFGDTTNFQGMVRDYINSSIYMVCYEYIVHTPYYIPSMANLSSEVSDAIAPYALWVLPSLFGALGAIIFYLRLILDPLRPDPGSIRILHRVILGSLSGMVLAWFWIPESAAGIDLSSIGFGLFALAFVFGFSLDVFFTMLDRFVVIANTAIGNMGGGRSTPT
jgi:hypothetical protein